MVAETAGWSIKDRWAILFGWGLISQTVWHYLQSLCARLCWRPSRTHTRHGGSSELNEYTYSLNALNYSYCTHIVQIFALANSLARFDLVRQMLADYAWHVTHEWHSVRCVRAFAITISNGGTEDESTVQTKWGIRENHVAHVDCGLNRIYSRMTSNQWMNEMWLSIPYRYDNCPGSISMDIIIIGYKQHGFSIKWLFWQLFRRRLVSGSIIRRKRIAAKHCLITIPVSITE